jgi:hypothetical protein
MAVLKASPGIREAMEQRNWKDAQENIEIVSKQFCGSANQYSLLITCNQSLSLTHQNNKDYAFLFPGIFL